MDQESKPRYMSDIGACNLAAAIIRRAAVDLWESAAPNKYSRPKGMTDAEYAKYVRRKEEDRRVMKEECRQFFLGDWFSLLLQDHHVTGPMMIERIEWMRKHRKSFNMDEEDAA